MGVAAMGENAKVIGMLCSAVGISPAEAGPKPFGPVGWHSLSGRISAAGLAGPSVLLGMSGEEIALRLEIPREKAEQVAQLLARAGRYTLELERIQSWGVWMVTQADAAYPRRLRERLLKYAPPVLFGCGGRDLMSSRGIAVVGSRNAGAPLLAYANEFGGGCAASGLTVVSGAARGVDETAMLGSLDSGGLAVGVVADSLERLVRRKRFRERLLDHRLLLLTPYHPSRRFDRGGAMARNKLIYCLADAAVVVSCDARRGGTWAGAEENLVRGWVPLYVRSAVDMPRGNKLLLEETFGGGSAHPLSARPDEAVAQLAAAVGGSGPGDAHVGPELGGAVSPQETFPLALRKSGEDAEGAGTPAIRSLDSEKAATGDDQRRREALAERDAFLAIYLVLLGSLSTPQKKRELAEALGVILKQASQWLSRAEERGWVKSTSKGFVRSEGAVELRADESALGVPVAESAGEFAEWVVEGVASVMRQDGGGKLRAIEDTRRLYGVVEAQARDWVEKAQPLASPSLLDDLPA